MASVSLNTSSSSRGPGFRVATREIALDFSAVGPDQSPHDLGTLSETAFRSLVEKFAALDPVKLVDGDPQLVVTARRGRFLILSSKGHLLVRDALDPQQAYVKFTPTELLTFLDTPEPTSGARPAASAPPPAPTAAELASAPIYGAFPTKAAPAAAPAAPATSTASAPASKRGLVIALSAIAIAAAAGWFFFLRAPAEVPPPPAPVGAYDRIASPDLLANLKARTTGTYATSGEASERLLELRADGTYRFQEFGSDLATTVKRNGTYGFVLRHGTKVALIRASDLGSIELREDGSLLCQQAIFKKVP